MGSDGDRVVELVGPVGDVTLASSHWSVFVGNDLRFDTVRQLCQDGGQFARLEALFLGGDPGGRNFAAPEERRGKGSRRRGTRRSGNSPECQTGRPFARQSTAPYRSGRKSMSAVSGQALRSGA